MGSYKSVFRNGVFLTSVSCWCLLLAPSQSLAEGLDSHSREELTTSVPHSIVPIVRQFPPDIDPCLEGETDFHEHDQPGFTIDDQTRLIDFGRTDPNGAAFLAEVFSVSPNNGQVALMINSANPHTNSYCQKLITMPLASDGAQEELDRGGEYLRGDFALRNFPVVYAGFQKSNPPLWSPSGSHVAFLKRRNNSTQVWVVAANGGSASRIATDLQDDVNRFAWTYDGLGLVVETRPGIRKQAAAIAKEAPRGFLFDERFSPQFLGRPIPTEDMHFKYSFVSLADGSVRDATEREIAFLVPQLPQGISQRARHYTINPDGHEAWTEPVDPEILFSPTRLVLRKPDGSRRNCELENCERIFRTWWSESGNTLFALQRTGWGGSQTALMIWREEDDQPERSLVTDDMLFGCRIAAEQVV